jgi:hypothetical protein
MGGGIVHSVQLSAAPGASTDSLAISTGVCGSGPARLARSQGRFPDHSDKIWLYVLIVHIGDRSHFEYAFEDNHEHSVLPHHKQSMCQASVADAGEKGDDEQEVNSSVHNRDE